VTCLKRATSRARFAEGLAPAQLEAAVHQVIDDHPEPAMLARVSTRMREAGLPDIADQVQSCLVLAAHNLVECVSQAAERFAR
jgi:hypothetical protein